MKKLVILLTLLIIRLTALADPAVDTTTPPAYQVNLLIFKYTSAPTMNPILWQDYQPLQLNNAFPLGYDNNNPFSYYQPLPKKQFALKNAAHRLARSNQYQLLKQIAWIQPANNTRIISIQGETQYNDIPELMGSIKITNTAYHYLNVTARFFLTEPQDNNLKTIMLNEVRRIRPKELNYLDNPAFGVLILVNPVQQTDNG